MDLEKLYEYFDIKLEKQNIEAEKEAEITEKDSEDTEKDTLATWDKSILPETEYTKDKKLKNQQKNEEICKMDISNKKLTRIMHATDIQLLNNVHANDLIKYNGSNKTQNVTYMVNKNIGEQNMLNKMTFKELKAVAKECEILKNYNLIYMVVNSMQIKNLSDKEVETVKFYKKLIDGELEESTMSILPFNWILKDCADSNCNVESTVASIRFCKIIEKLNQMQSIESSFELKEKHKHFLYAKIYENMNKKQQAEQKEEKITHSNCLYLVI